MKEIMERANKSDGRRQSNKRVSKLNSKKKLNEIVNKISGRIKAIQKKKS